MARKPIQFDWSRQWKKKVSPLLSHPFVQSSLTLGMKLLDPTWEPGDPPHALGRDDPGRRIVKGKLSWHQPLGCCHWIVFFSYSIGLLARPDLRWDIVTGDAHTVAVGYEQTGDPALVMDILLFNQMSADESLRFTQIKIPGASSSGWAEGYKFFVDRSARLLGQSAEPGGADTHPQPTVLTTFGDLTPQAMSSEQLGNTCAAKGPFALLSPRRGGAELVQPPATAHVTSTSPECHGAQLQC